MTYWDNLILALVDIGIAAHTVECMRAQLNARPSVPGYAYVGPRTDFPEQYVLSQARTVAVWRSEAIRGAIAACRTRSIDERTYTIDNFRSGLISMNDQGVTLHAQPAPAE